MATKEQLLNSIPEISAAPINMEMPVLWGDMDSAQHVNNLIYLKWSETSRIRLFEEIDNIRFDGKNGVILAWQDIKYIFPMTFPDNAVITAAITEIRDDRFFVESKIYSVKHQRIAAITKQSIIPYDYDLLQKAPLTDVWRERLKGLMAKPQV